MLELAIFVLKFLKGDNMFITTKFSIDDVVKYVDSAGLTCYDTIIRIIISGNKPFTVAYQMLWRTSQLFEQDIECKLIELESL